MWRPVDRRDYIDEPLYYNGYQQDFGTALENYGGNTYRSDTLSPTESQQRRRNTYHGSTPAEGANHRHSCPATPSPPRDLIDVEWDDDYVDDGRHRAPLTGGYQPSESPRRRVSKRGDGDVRNTASSPQHPLQDPATNLGLAPHRPAPRHPRHLPDSEYQQRMSDVYQRAVEEEDQRRRQPGSQPADTAHNTGTRQSTDWRWSPDKTRWEPRGRTAAAHVNQRQPVNDGSDEEWGNDGDGDQGADVTWGNDGSDTGADVAWDDTHHDRGFADVANGRNRKAPRGGAARGRVGRSVAWADADDDYRTRAAPHERGRAPHYADRELGYLAAGQRMAESDDRFLRWPHRVPMTWNEHGHLPGCRYTTSAERDPAGDFMPHWKYGGRMLPTQGRGRSPARQYADEEDYTDDDGAWGEEEYNGHAVRQVAYDRRTSPGRQAYTQGSPALAEQKGAGWDSASSAYVAAERDRARRRRQGKREDPLPIIYSQGPAQPAPMTHVCYVGGHLGGDRYVVQTSRPRSARPNRRRGGSGGEPYVGQAVRYRPPVPFPAKNKVKFTDMFLAEVF